MKKLISAILSMGIILTYLFSVSAADMELSYKSSADFSSTQGNRNWYWQYNHGGTYSEYKNMEYSATSSGADRWVVFNSDGNVAEFITSTGLQAKGSSVNNKTAFVWIAPYSGNVNLASIGNVRKSYKGGVSNIEANIAHTDAEFNVIHESLWSASIDPKDDVGEGKNYDIDVDVKAGDRIYFEMGSQSASSATIVWQMNVTYNQAIEFFVNSEGVSSTNEIPDSATVNASIYAKPAITEATSVFIGIYDNMGRLRGVSQVTDIDPDKFESGYIDISAEMPKLDTYEASYENWMLSAFGVTSVSGRYYPVELSEGLSLN